MRHGEYEANTRLRRGSSLAAFLTRFVKPLRERLMQAKSPLNSGHLRLNAGSVMVAHHHFPLVVLSA
jgi:hypothetical protein